MAQIGNDAAGTPVLEMVVRKLEEPLEVGERTAIAVLDVITPLGVVLTEGLSVSIDGGTAGIRPVPDLYRAGLPGARADRQRFDIALQARQQRRAFGSCCESG